MEGQRERGPGVVVEICAQLLRRRALRWTWGTTAAEISGSTKRVVVVFFVVVVTWVVVVRLLEVNRLLLVVVRVGGEGKKEGTEEKG